MRRHVFGELALFSPEIGPLSRLVGADRFADRPAEPCVSAFESGRVTIGAGALISYGYLIGIFL